MHDDASITPSFVIHSHLLDGIATSVCGLPPFLPASDPCLPNTRLGKVLLLHHLESKSFTYRDTQLSRYNDLAAHPPVLPVSSERVAHTACTGQVRAFAHTFEKAAPRGGFGIWWLYPPNPALAGTDYL